MPWRSVVRFRPQNKAESRDADGNLTVEVSPCGCDVQIEGEHNFKVSRVYPAGTSQEDVYNYGGKHLVDAVVGGGEAAILAYGATGSGKTFSMMGVLGGDLRGIIPRMIEDTFEGIRESDYNKNKGAKRGQFIKTTVSVSMYQDISVTANYGGQVRDLFGDSGGDGFTKIQCGSKADVMNAMDQGFKGRSQVTVDGNDHSLSSCVVVLELSRKQGEFASPTKRGWVNKDTRQIGWGADKDTSGRLTMVDLIGPVPGTRAGKVDPSFAGLWGALDGNSCDTNLTRILQGSINGNVPTTLICAASPCKYDMDNTINTLRFAQSASS